MLDDQQINEVAMRDLQRMSQRGQNSARFELGTRRKTEESLRISGLSIQELLETYSRESYKELSQKLAMNAAPMSLKQLAYELAVAENNVKTFVKDLLFRHLIHQFPNGWPQQSGDDIHFSFHRWLSDISDLAKEFSLIVFSLKVSRHLSFVAPPVVGWIPITRNDPIIEQLFDRYWPNIKG
jgi:hypothetical protein